jgi:hypothetical protein
MCFVEIRVSFIYWSFLSLAHTDTVILEREKDRKVFLVLFGLANNAK